MLGVAKNEYVAIILLSKNEPDLSKLLLLSYQ